MFSTQIKIFRKFNFCFQNGIKVFEAYIAYDAFNIFDFDYTDEEFEKLCDLVLQCYELADSITTEKYIDVINSIIMEADDKHKVIEEMIMHTVLKKIGGILEDN